MRKIYILIALGVFIAILSAFNQKADTVPISTLRERCSYPYDAQGQLTKECSDLIFQAVKERGTKTGKYPSHTAPDQEGRVQW